jgi:hypothetical protein
MKRLLIFVVLTWAGAATGVAQSQNISATTAAQSPSPQLSPAKPSDIDGTWMGAMDKRFIDDLRQITEQIKKDEDVVRYFLAFSLVFGPLVGLMLHFSRREKPVNTHTFLTLERPHTRFHSSKL